VVPGLEVGQEEQEFAPAGGVGGFSPECPENISPYQPGTGLGLEEAKAAPGDAHYVGAHQKPVFLSF
jgi:hypothetical protein